MTKLRGKVLYTEREEGVVTQVRMDSKNNFKTFNFVSQFIVFRGYFGLYRGKNVFYKNYLPRGLVRHHEIYNDKDIDEGVVMITQKEHVRRHLKI